MACPEALEVVAHLQFSHAHHPLHQVLPMGVDPLASLERFDQQIEQLGFRSCVGYALGLSTHHPLEEVWSRIQGDVSLI